MSHIAINAIEVPPGAGPELEARFAARAGAVDGSPGFVRFRLLRPTDGANRYFVFTEWESAQDFENWRKSQQFTHGHAEAGKKAPVGIGAELLQFEDA